MSTQQLYPPPRRPTPPRALWHVDPSLLKAPVSRVKTFWGLLTVKGGPSTPYEAPDIEWA